MNLFDSRCRTDYMLAPTRTSVVDLEIITPPAKPIIYDEDDNSIIRTKLGPYRLGKRHWVWNNTKFRIGRKEWGGRTNERILGRGRSWRCSTSRSYESFFYYFHNKFLQRENDNVNLRCEVIGGNPAPTVTWWREHTLLDTRQTVYQHKVVSHLTINQVSR